MVEAKVTKNYKSKPIFKCLNPYKPYEESHCLLTISVGQEVHEGDKFGSTIELVNTRFQECTICVDDSLQRHSIAISQGFTAEHFMAYSIELGTQWLKRNQPYLDQLTIPHQIIRWNHWLSHPDFTAFHQKVLDLYHTNGECKLIFDQTIRSFLDRFIPRIEGLKPTEDVAFKLCFDYLIEECAALCLWVQAGYDYEVYPSKRSPAMDYIHQNIADPAKTGKATYVYIKFKNRKQLKPQTLALSCQFA